MPGSRPERVSHQSLIAHIYCFPNALERKFHSAIIIYFRNIQLIVCLEFRHVNKLLSDPFLMSGRLLYFFLKYNTLTKCVAVERTWSPPSTAMPALPIRFVNPGGKLVPAHTYHKSFVHEMNVTMITEQDFITQENICT